MPKHINTFLGGLDLDTNVNSYSNKAYPYATNFKLTTSEGGESATLSSMKYDVVRITAAANTKIIGGTILRDKIVLFTKSTLAPNIGSIHVIDITDNEITLSSSNRLVSKTDFSFGDSIDVVARYESDTIQKVYWADGVNQIRFVDINEANLSTKPTTQFDIVAEATIGNIALDRMISGSLKTGVYQYAFCFYNLNGQETPYSTATPPIPVSNYGLQDANSVNFRGSDVGTLTDKGVRVIITTSEVRYNRLRIIRLFYSTVDGVPEVDIVYEGDTLVYFSDGGSTTLGTLILEDYRRFFNIVVPATITSKNDYLLAANIKESFFDVPITTFDARAYRFRSDTLCWVWESAGNPDNWFEQQVNYIVRDTAGSNPNYNGVPEDYNAGNPFNIIKQDVNRDAGTIFMYQANGVAGQSAGTVGGEGKHIKYSFINSTRSLDNINANLKVGVTTDSNVNGYNNLSNPIVLHRQLGYQRGEIYRFAVVFYDKYGRQSFAKWIGDVRFPCETYRGTFNFTDVILNGAINDLGIKFEIKPDGVTALKNAGIVGWQIVRADRTYQQATVKDCGYISTLKYYSDVVRSAFNRLYIDATTNYIFEYDCPETTYLKNNFNKYDRLDLIETETQSVYKKNNTSATKANVSIVKDCLKNNHNLVAKYKSIINILKVDSNIEETRTSLSSLGFAGSYYNVYNPIADGVSTTTNRTTRGTTMLLQVNTNTIGSTGRRYARRRSFTYPYGGWEYSDRQNTVYYPCSPIQYLTQATTSTLNVWGGDCYIGWYEYHRGLWSDKESVVKYGTPNPVKTDDSDNYLSAQIYYNLVETKINLNYNINTKWSQLDNGNIIDSSSNVLATAPYVYNAIRETKGAHIVWQRADGAIQNTYIQDFDLYTYNSVYSVPDKSKVFFPKPSDFQDNSTIDSRVIYSQKKINGEFIDSWTSFYANNFKDVDTAYGKIVKLMDFNNRLLYFQERGIGVLAMNEREVVKSELGNTLTIGTGEMLDRYDYISNKSGTKFPKSIVPSNTTIYYVDDFNKKICAISNDGVKYISDLTNVRNFLKNKTFAHAASLFNKDSNEIWINIDSETILFNEYLNVFTSFVVGTDDSTRGTFSDYLQLGKDTYRLTTGQSSYYKLEGGTSFRSNELQLYINPNNIITNRFDSIVMNTLLYDGTNAEVNSSFTTLQASNNYQDTGAITLTPGTNIRRRFRSWIMNQLRNSADTSRLFDTYLKVKLNKPANTNKIKVFDILTEYSPVNNQ